MLKDEIMKLENTSQGLFWASLPLCSLTIRYFLWCVNNLTHDRSHLAYRGKRVHISLGKLRWHFESNNKAGHHHYKLHLCVNKPVYFSIPALLLNWQRLWRLIASGYQSPMCCCLRVRGRFVWIIHHHTLFTTASHNNFFFFFFTFFVAPQEVTFWPCRWT